ncbi:hypothetical protein OH77DRAFT_1523906 [Trametes cingulata]|nr:hypothetical protein OH77DRAFT_1523906 [Trametes cingulata]
MAPLELNDDVLRHVVSFLHGRDALQVALCSKYMCSIALPRVPAIAVCASPRELRETCAYMLSGNPLRAQYLEDLTISYLAFDYPVPEEPEIAQHMFSDYWDFSQARLIGDLLLQAPRKRRITLERLHPCLHVDPRIGQALASMDQLVAADLATIADATFARLPPLNANLRWLRLGYFWEEDDELPGETKTLPPLLTVLGRYRHLHTLELWNFNPPAVGVRQYFSVDNMPSLPAVRNLRLCVSSVGALELVEFCPNLLDVDFTLSYDEPLVQLPDGPRWPSLRRLTLSTYRVIPWILNRVNGAKRLRITEKLGLGEEDEKGYINMLLRLLAQTSPIALSLSVKLQAAPMAFWDQVAELAPRLRTVELTVSLAAPSLANKNWLDTVPDALRPLPLVHLSVIVPRTVTVTQPPPRQGEVLECAALDRQHYADARAVEEQRAEAIAALPERLMAAILTLRLLSTSTAPPNRDNLEGRGQPYDELERVLRTCKPREGDGKMDTKYWRVVGDGQQRYMQEVSAVSEEAERMRAVADDVGLEGLLSQPES